MTPMHAVTFNPVEPRLVATANAKQGIALWDVRKPKRYIGVFINVKNVIYSSVTEYKYKYSVRPIKAKKLIMCFSGTAHITFSPIKHFYCVSSIALKYCLINIINCL